MSFAFTLQKILDMKEKQKFEAEKEYSKATKQFEEIATKLYQLLKKKEDLEIHSQQIINKGIPIYQLQQNQSTLTRLQEEIDRQQEVTSLARDFMYKKQDELVLASLEYKKYEKLKEIQHEEYMAEQKQLDNKRMDEISIQLYVNR